ncbi:hypothetical protein [Mycoplasma hafezii]|uniref:hypothetical protein n=1 Tax=Mycoplasma hafezii TaxID=525886 RepID=UPI003CEF235E
MLLLEKEEAVVAPEFNTDAWLFITWALVLVVGYFIAFSLYRKTNFFKKIKTWIILVLPFALCLIIALPMVISDINLNITTYAASYPTVFFFGVACAVFLERWNEWREKKTAAAKKAHPSYFEKQESYKNNKKNK